MSSRPCIFISAVSKELRPQRELVAKTLRFLGCEPIWQDQFGTHQGNIREVLSHKLQHCDAAIQLVGRALGGVMKDAQRVRDVMSYTQFEAHLAEEAQKPVWYLLIAESWRLPLCDEQGGELEAESAEEVEDQRTYWRKVKRSPNLYHIVSDDKELEIAILKMLHDLDGLREVATPWIAQGNQLAKQTATISTQPEFLTKGDARALFEEFLQRLEHVRQQADPGREEAGEDEIIANLAEVRGQPDDDVRRQLNQTAAAIQMNPDEPALKRSQAAFARREYREAEQLAVLAVQQLSRAGFSARAQLLEAWMLAGKAAYENAHFQDAVNYYRAASELTDEQRYPAEWASVQHWAASALHESGQHAEAAGILQRVVELRQRILGPEHFETLASRNNLAEALRSLKDYALAEQEHRAVLECRQRILGAKDPDTLASRNNLAIVLRAQNKHLEAEAEHRAVLSIREQVLESGHPDIFQSCYNLALCLEHQKQFLEAKHFMERAIAGRRTAHGPNHPLTQNAERGLRHILIKLGQLPKAHS